MTVDRLEASSVALSVAGKRTDADAGTATTPIFLGSYRLLLAFFVFSAHAVWPLAQTVTRSEIGPIGVFCFFIVSGYLITLTIEAHYTDSVRRFLLNRFLRIYPTFWISMVVAAAAVLAMGTTYVTTNFYLRGWTWDNILRCVLIFPAVGGNDTWGPIPIGWTLQVEVSFYLVIALVYVVIGRLLPKWRHPVAVCICLACLIAYIVLIETTKLPLANGLLFTPFFVTGVMTAILSRIETNQHALRLFGGIVLAIALALCGKFLFFTLPLTPGYVTGTIVTFPIVCGLFFFLLLPPVASRLARFKRIDTFLGDLTYPVYTLHFGLNQVTSFWLFPYLGPSTVFVQMGVTVAAAYLVVRFSDRPLSRLRTRVREA